MSKLSYIFIGLIITLFIVIGMTAFVQRSDTSVPVVPVATYTNFNITLPSKSGNALSIENFLNKESVIPDEKNPGLYSLGNTMPINSETNNKSNYVITYQKETGYFNITLLQKPLAVARKDAEQYLQNLLELDNNSMCDITYMVSVPGYVDQEASGIDYRFSFCPDATQL